MSASSVASGASAVVVTANSQTGKKLLDTLQSDLKNISNEAKRKHPPLKEVRLNMNMCERMRTDLFCYDSTNNNRLPSLES